jgi:hypothetical protein
VKVYMGYRLLGISYVFVWEAARPQKPVRLDPRIDLWEYSPSRLEWGTEGTGPAQLALALASHCLGDDERAMRIHQQLKQVIRDELDRDMWSMTDSRLMELIHQCENQKGIIKMEVSNDPKGKA